MLSARPCMRPALLLAALVWSACSGAAESRHNLSPDGGILPGPGTPAPDPRSRARVMFSGHSLLDNPMPDYVALIAQGRGMDHGWNQQNTPGSPLRARTWGAGNWAGYRTGKNREGVNMDVVAELRTPRTLPAAGDRYDSLLVTERHDILGVMQWEDTVRQLRHYHDRLVEGGAPGATTYFYHTWLTLEKAAPASWMAYEKNALVAWECAVSKVNMSLEAAGRTERARTIPGGAALVDLVERVLAGQVRGMAQGSTSERLNLLFTDNVHLTPLGHYFMASVHFSALYRQSPEGAPAPAGLSTDTAADLQRIAWAFVSTYNAQAQPRTMQDCRTRVPRDVCPGYGQRIGRPDIIPNCQNFFGSNDPSNPLSDAVFTPLPAPY